jgi:hypothetical protein
MLEALSPVLRREGFLYDGPRIFAQAEISRE